MAPGGWGTAEQKHFFELWMPEFLIKKGARSLDSFWVKMKAAWYAEFPEETNLGLPVQDIDPDPNAARPRKLTPAENTLLDQAIARRDKQLHNAFNNRYAKERGGAGRSARSMAAMLFKARPKRRRRHQVLEVYQMEHKEVVQEGLKNSEYDLLNEAAQCRDADGEWIDDEDDDAKTKRISDARSRRMKVKRRVVQELWDDEPEEVKERIREIAKREVVETAPDIESDEGERKERTPEEYQLSLDESMQVAEMFLHEFQRMTGWVGVLVYAGPVPRLGGEMGVKSICFGDTPGKVNFENWHPQWKKAVTNPLFKFARQAIPRSVRAGRAIVSADGSDDDADSATPTKPKKKTGKKKAPAAATTTTKTSATPSAPEKTAAAPSTAKSSGSATAPPAGKSKPARRPRKAGMATSRSVSLATVPTTPTAPATVSSELEATDDRPVANDTVSDQEYEDVQQIESADTNPMDDDPNAGGGDALAYPAFSYPQYVDASLDFGTSGVSRTSQDAIGLRWDPTNDPILPDAFGELGDTYEDVLGVPHSGAFSAFEGGGFDSGAMGEYATNNYLSTVDDGSSSLNDIFSYGAAESQTLTQWSSGSVFGGGHATSDGSSVWSLRPTPDERLRNDSWLAGVGTGASSTSTMGAGTSPLPPLESPLQPRPSPSPLETPRSSPTPLPSRPAPVHRALAPPVRHTPPTGPVATPERSSSTPRRSSPLTGPSLRAEAGGTEVPASTPQRAASAPRVSSPLAQPPMQAGRATTPPPPPSSLPPRLRPSPARVLHGPTPPSPPVYPISRPMANAPKMPTMKMTPGAMAKKMAGVRDARKGKAKKGAKQRAAQKEPVVGGNAGAAVGAGSRQEGGSAAVGTGSREDSGGAAASTGSGEVGTMSSGVAGGVVEAPALVFSSTNNNRKRILQEDQQRRAKEKAAAEAKKERMRLHNPDGESQLVIVLPACPRRTIQPPQNKGPVMSLIDKKQAEDDAALLAALNKDKTAKATKRKIDSQENVAPVAKRVKSK